MTLVREGLEELRFGIVAPLKSKDFVGGGNEMPRQLDDTLIRPDGPPARDAVVSRATQRMAVHRPELEMTHNFGPHKKSTNHETIVS